MFYDRMLCTGIFFIIFAQIYILSLEKANKKEEMSS